MGNRQRKSKTYKNAVGAGLKPSMAFSLRY